MLADLHPVKGWAGQYVLPKGIDAPVPDALAAAENHPLHAFEYRLRGAASYRLRRPLSQIGEFTSRTAGRMRSHGLRPIRLRSNFKELNG
jgi:hypothetical protein